MTNLLAGLGVILAAVCVAGGAMAADTQPQPLQKQPNHHPQPPVQPTKGSGGSKGSDRNFVYQVISQHDAASGLATGKRTHNPTP